MANGTWKIARRGNVQLPLVIVLALAVVLVLVGKTQSGLFDAARMRVTDWMAPVLESVHAPVESWRRWTGSLDELFSVYQENIKLKEENARLRQWQNVAVVMGDRVKRYQALLHAVPDPDLHSVLARVIGRASRPFLETMILGAGKDNAVKPGEAVVDARGMIGRIYLAGARTSWVILLTDLNSRIPVTISHGNGESGNIQAIMAGDNSAMPGLDTLLQAVTLHPGDQVVSSGDGGLLPPSLPIGTVVADPHGGFRVALLADPASSEDVEILAFRKAPETLPPTSAGQLPATAAGLPPAAPAPVPTGPASATPALVPAAALAPAAKPATVSAAPRVIRPAPVAAEPEPETDGVPAAPTLAGPAPSPAGTSPPTGHE